MAQQLCEAMEGHYRRVAAWSLALERTAKANVGEILEIAEAVDQHFAWEPYSDPQQAPDPLAEAGLACLRLSTAEDLDRALASLPVSPVVVNRALRLLIDGDWSAAELEAIARTDQSIAADLVAAANSWIGGARARISTISHAIVYLGEERTSRILYAASLKRLFSTPRLRLLWQHSLVAAQVAETIAESSGAADPKEAFLAGLVHDIGSLAMAALPSAFQSAFEHLTRCCCEPVIVERVLCGFSHAHAGARALRGWNFPEPLAAAIEFHHQPEKTEQRLAAILFLVEHWTDSEEDVPSAARLKLALDRTGMAEADLAQLVLKDDRTLQALRYT